MIRSKRTAILGVTKDFVKQSTTGGTWVLATSRPAKTENLARKSLQVKGLRSLNVDHTRPRAAQQGSLTTE